MWARGLKPNWDDYCDVSTRSRPVWARGLKLIDNANKEKQGKVAPRVGAWIETSESGTVSVMSGVAPRVGAWIETEARLQRPEYLGVAPRVGAWIETAIVVCFVSFILSRPVWARGLKLFPRVSISWRINCVLPGLKLRINTISLMELCSKGKRE